MDFSITYISIAAIFCIFMTWGVGANDLANVMSTTMGSKALSVRQALLIAIIFEFAGALFGGANITETMREKIINIPALDNEPIILIHGMIAVLGACTIWMNLASFFGLPVSITNTLVGAMVGFGGIVLGREAIYWNEVTKIAISWVTSPLLSGIGSYLLFVNIQQAIFVRSDPLIQAKKHMPIYLIFVSIVLSYITVFKVLRHFENLLDLKNILLLTLTAAIFITLTGFYILNRIPEQVTTRRRDTFMQVEKYFGILMAMTACAMVFAHGANDVAIAVGPLTIIHSLVANIDTTSTNYPIWITILGCIGVTSGLLMYGWKVIETVGSSITTLTPSRAFAATLAAAITVVFATTVGIPISATQTLVGAVLGVGLARGIGALNLLVVRNIFASWILTLPIASIITIIFYKLIHFIFT